VWQVPDVPDLPSPGRKAGVGSEGSLTPEEYLEIERATAEIRSEYYDGQMFAMSGGTYSHSLTILNLVGLFRSALAGQWHDCRERV
jgi:Uma2 family endonuclease